MLELFENGGPVMYPLLLCSIIVMTVIIERIIFWVILDSRRDQSLVDDVLELCRVGDWESVRKKASGSKDYIIRILVSGILHREFSMSKAMESTAADEIKEMLGELKIVRTVSVGKPIFDSEKNHLRVPFEVEVEIEGKITVWKKQPSVQQISGQSGRWAIFGF